MLALRTMRILAAKMLSLFCGAAGGSPCGRKYNSRKKYKIPILGAPLCLAGGPFKPGFGLSGDVPISPTLSSRPEQIIAKR